jgi:hypothetical protein
MIRSTKQELHKVKDSLGLLKHKLDGISEQDLPESKRRAFNELKELSEELNRMIRHFRT